MVGLYLNPPEQAIVLCVDEKSQIQALDRTQPWLPIKKGRAATMTHDYKRNGTTTLFAALEVVTGRVIGECLPRRWSSLVVFYRAVSSWLRRSRTLMCRSRHWRARAESPISVMLSHDPCLGVWWISKRWARARAFSGSDAT